MKKQMMLVAAALLIAANAHAWCWFTWCTSKTTGDDCVENSGGVACHVVTNPRGECDGSMNPFGCTGAGDTVTITITDGNCSIGSTFSNPYCDGTTSTMEGTAAC